MNEKNLKTLISSGTIIIAVALYLIFGPSQEEKDHTTTTEQIPVEQTIVDETAEQSEPPQTVEQNDDLAANYTITTDYAMQATGNDLLDITFVSNNDGDTLKVKVNGETEKIRLLMVDTPEMNYNKGEPMPYAEAAKEYTYQLLKNAKSIQMVYDVGPATDKYDRQLTYVFVDGVLLQEVLLREGLAAVRYVNKPNNTLEAELRAIQKEAENTKVNIWSHDGYFQKDGFHEEVIN